MALSGSTSRHCYAVGCGNGDYRLLRWKQQICTQHNVYYCDEKCTCTPPFQLFTFPTAKKQPEERQIWLRHLSRADPGHSHRHLEPKKDHRVCSEHFIDGKPTKENPYPTKCLGHSKKNVEGNTPRTSRYSRRTERLADKVPHSQDRQVKSEKPLLNESNIQLLGAKFIIHVLLFFVRTLKSEIQSLKQKNLDLQSEVALTQKKLKAKSWSSILKSDFNVQFYTGIPSFELFVKLHNVIAPFVTRRWRGISCLSNKHRRFCRSPKKFGPERKLSSQDEFLLTLMWIRLGLLKKDLADRFHISASLCSQIFNSWITSMAKVLGNLIYWPSKEEVVMSKPSRYNHLVDLRTIIDCSEIFIEKPKDPHLQSSTWSNYKQNNTAKFLIGVAPNSSITFLSKVYNGRASDKAITIHSGFLDKLEPYDMVQADRGFNIQDECAARRIYLHVPPGKRGKSQMTIAANVKTSRIARLRILVEQVIRRLKSFRIIKYTVPIALVPALDKILIVCAALCNLKKPIYSK